MRAASSIGLLVVAVAGVACADLSAIEVNAGPFTFEADTAQVMVPPPLRSAPGTPPGQIPAIPCRMDMQCPQFPGAMPPVRCVMGTCNPDPVTFDLGTSVIDLTTYYAQLGTLGSRVSAIELRQLSWRATASALRTAVGPTEIFWGPEAAASPRSDGVQRLGRVPVLRFGPSGELTGAVELEPSGTAGLSAHLLRVSRRFRLFARPAVDLAPGDPLPAGTARIALQMRVRVEGQLLP